MTQPVPVLWLDPDAVALWLKLNPPPAAGSDDRTLLEFCCLWAQGTAERYRPEFWTMPAGYAGDGTDPDGVAVYVPDSECLGAATALAGRLWRRRSSPAGVETFADTTLYVARFDPEIERGLHMGGWLAPNRSFGAVTS